MSGFAGRLQRAIVRPGRRPDDDDRAHAGRDGAYANVTGNYEVFHAKLSKPFREQFPVERLARRFQEFNKKHVDFDVIAALKPAYDPAPKVDDEGRLQVKGHFPTEPLRINFDLAFIPSDGEWKLIGINVKIEDPK
ncbi:hypothetical protein SAMN02990966_02030 [Rhodospirillales bacterium URHD0017]|nr:hypothetical protein SAMN02990966_02030 [Rhodospirillales bacterium URHD0017]